MNGEYNEHRKLHNEVGKPIWKFYLDAERTLLIEGNRACFFRYVNTRLCKSRDSQIMLQSDGSVLTSEAAVEDLIKNYVKISPLVHYLVAAAVVTADHM